MKKTTYCLALLLLAVMQTFGQVFIGNGTDTEQHAPFDPYYGYTYSQTIYTAAEINAAGNINSLSWYFVGQPGSNLSNSKTLKIYLGHTSKSTFSSLTDWQAVADMTEVYSGDIVANGPGMINVQFTTPFAYNGTDNLVVATAELQPGYNDSSDNFSNYGTASNRTIVFQNDGTVPNPASPPEANSLSSFSPNIILGGITPSCPVAQFLSVHNITDTSATVYWAPIGGPPTGGTQYYISESDTNPTESTPPTGDVSSIGMAVINSGLNPNTHYNVWLRSICNGSLGAWSFSTPFTTACSPVDTFNANFDTTAINTLPDCWTSIIRGENVDSWTSINVVDTQAHSGQNSIKIDNQSTPNTSDIILVSPKLNTVVGATHRLKFFAKGNVPNHLQIGTLNENTSTAVFSNVTPIETTTNYAEYTVSFPDYTVGTDTYVGIKLNAEASNNPIFLDDIRWEVIPACADVTSIEVNTIATTTATVNWDANGTSQWEVAYSETATEPTDLTPVAATANTKGLTGLTPNTAYKVWVRSICGVNPGAWIGPVDFRTACIPVATFTENFESVTAPQLPGCWSAILRGPTLNAYAGIVTTPYNGNTAPYNVYLSGGSTPIMAAENDVILVTPNLQQIPGHRIKFFAKGPGEIEVGTLDSNTNDAIFSDAQTIEIPASTTFIEYTVDYKESQTTDTYVGFRLVKHGSMGTMRLDDIRWEISPDCNDVTGITVPTHTSESATVAWDANEDTQWEVVYGTSNVTDPTTLESAVIAVDTDSTVIIPGLADNTNYKVWVRSICNAGSHGAWIGPVAFKTDCTATTDFSENFDGVTAPQLADCWTTIRRGPFGSNINETFIKAEGAYPHSGNNAIHYHSDVNTPDPADSKDLILVSPKLSNLAANTHRLRFYAYAHYNTLLQVGTLDNNSPTAIFTPFGAVTAVTAGIYTEYTVDFTQYDGNVEDTHIGIRFTPPFQQMDLFIDDVVWEEAPSCHDVSAIAVQEISTADALVSWNAEGTENWQISYAESTVTDANTGTIQNSTTSDASFQLSELIPATTYNVWVRSICANDVKGDWIGPVKFVTDCAPASTFIENFENTTLLTVPTCWSTIRRGTGLSTSAYMITSSSEASEGSQAFYIYGGSPASNPATSDIILVSPPVDNLADHTNSLSFYLKGTANIVVGTLNDNTADAVFTPYDTTITGTSTYAKYTVNFNNYTGTDHYIGLRYNATNPLVGLDNIVWDASLSNGDFDNADFTAYPNPVKDILNLSYKQTISNVTVYNVLGQKVIDKTVDSNATTVNMASLSRGTYIVKVTADSRIKTLKIVKE